MGLSRRQFTREFKLAALQRRSVSALSRWLKKTRFHINPTGRVVP